MQKNQHNFSGKMKKQQLQEKRARKAYQEQEDDEGFKQNWKNNAIIQENSIQEKKAINPRNRNQIQQPSKFEGIDLITVFASEDKEVVKQRIYDAQKPIQKVNQNWQYQGGAGDNAQEIDIPVRPPWNYKQSKQELETQEKKYFDHYIQQVYSKFGAQNLNHFEHNLEVWRQLWRVVEKSDVILLIADVRNPTFYLNESLIKFVQKESQRPMIIVLTKIDLVPEDAADQWKQYFIQKYDCQVVFFSSLPLSTFKAENKSVKQRAQMLKGKQTTQADGIQDLWNAISNLKVKKLIKNNFEYVDAKQYLDGIKVEKTQFQDLDDEYSNSSESEEGPDLQEVEESISFNFANTLVIGTLGQPNVGKSSLINGLFGKKVVTCSRTPGKTKHFQTIHVTDKVILCDCPGLVFPRAFSSRALQVLFGTLTMNVLREPYTALRFVCERIDLMKIYSLSNKELDSDVSVWEICEMLAINRGFITAKTGRPDTYKSGQFILKDIFSGKIEFFFLPQLENYQKIEKKIMNEQKQYQPKEKSEKEEKQNIQIIKNAFSAFQIDDDDDDDDDSNS